MVKCCPVMLQEHWVGYQRQEASPGVCFAGGKNATRSWSLGPLFPQSFNVVWGGSLGTSSRKTWEILVGRADSLEYATSWPLTLIRHYVNKFTKVQVGSFSFCQGHRNFFLHGSFLLLLYKVSAFRL